MSRSKHWLDVFKRIERMRLEDSVIAARRSLRLQGLDELVARSREQVAAIVKKIPSHWAEAERGKTRDGEMIDRLVAGLRSDPMHPENWHRRLVDAELAKPQAAAIYMQLRRSLWSWEEFAGVSRGAMAILHTIIELARDEAFPWYLAVPAEHVRRLARMSTRNYIRCIQQLDVLAITRPARVIQLAQSDGMARFPGTVDETVPAEPIAQWVVRYRRGIPWNKKRAAWWINYDLLTASGRVHRCFIVSGRTLSANYRDRNRMMGPQPESWFVSRTEDSLASLEETLSRAGPLPPAGLRAPLWRGQQ